MEKTRARRYLRAHECLLKRLDSGLFTKIHQGEIRVTRTDLSVAKEGVMEMVLGRFLSLAPTASRPTFQIQAYFVENQTALLLKITCPSTYIP